jgi:hypothetical protein
MNEKYICAFGSFSEDDFSADNSQIICSENVVKIESIWFEEDVPEEWRQT